MKRLLGWFAIVAGALACVIGLVSFVASQAQEDTPWLLLLFPWLLLVLGVGFAVSGYLLIRGEIPLGSVYDGSTQYRDGEHHHHSHDGQPIEVAFQAASRHSNRRTASRLTIALPLSVPLRAQFNRETAFDRTAKKMGVAKEHQTGDSTFDDAVYVRGPFDGYVEAYLDDADKRQTILTLLNQGFTEVRVTPRSVEAHWENFNPDDDDRPRLPEETAGHLAKLADHLPEATAPRTRGVAGWHDALHAAVWFLLFVYAAMILMLVRYRPLRTGDYVLPVLLALILAVLLFGWLGIRSLAGQAKSHDRLRRLGLASLILIPFGSIGTVVGLNGLLDASPPEVREARVEAKRSSKSRRSTNYLVSVNDIKKPGSTIDFRVTSADFGRVMAGQSKVVFTVHRGALGLEWWVQKKVVP
jgi:hypothetical protein